jgi:hypothetical protein
MNVTPQMHDEEPGAQAAPFRWDDPGGEESGTGESRRRALYVAAAIPWVIVGLIFARGSDRSDVSHSVHPESVATDAPTDAAGDDATAESAFVDAVPMPEALLFGGRSGPAASDAAAVAVLVARDWLGDVGPALGDVREGRDSYVEHLAVEAVDFPASGAAVVAVVAVVLDVVDGEYAGARAVRVAVPVRLDRHGARPAGHPWLLPPPDLRTDEPQWGEEIVDPAAQAEAGAALQAAGYREIEIEQFTLSDGWPLRVVARAVAPGEQSPTTHVIWLRDHLGALVVAGWLPEPGVRGTSEPDDPGEDDR